MSTYVNILIQRPQLQLSSNMRFTPSLIIVFLVSVSLAVLASSPPEPVEGDESVPDTSLSDENTASEDGAAADSIPALDVLGGLAEGAGGVVGGLYAAAKHIKTVVDDAKEDKKARNEFTKLVVASLRETFPSFNFVICHTKHSYEWDGDSGSDWGHWHQEFDIKVGGTVGFEIYYARSGWFKRIGDGGFLNVSA
ncbi:hypothetical protein BD779DRAFT_1667992 [Infundibulicybe gibba]|nr:hypothetical protein BD779DRAFT_1667992 [Infundibulicybe gibba]